VRLRRIRMERLLIDPDRSKPRRRVTAFRPVFLPSGSSRRLLPVSRLPVRPPFRNLPARIRPSTLGGLAIPRIRTEPIAEEAVATRHLEEPRAESFGIAPLENARPVSLRGCPTSRSRVGGSGSCRHSTKAKTRSEFTSIRWNGEWGLVRSDKECPRATNKGGSLRVPSPPSDE
jgi:hypothetical protein